MNPKYQLVLVLSLSQASIIYYESHTVFTLWMILYVVGIDENYTGGMSSCVNVST